MPALLAERFEIGELIGQGGMGQVYAGHDTRTNQPVAIKVLLPGQQATADAAERFAREGTALRALDHPNIVKLLAMVHAAGQQYLVMEYLPGGSLADLLRRQPQLEVRQVLELAVDLADALARVHRLGILHRDIKPENVLLAADGSPRLTDFGVAQLGDARQLTQTGALVGTCAYLSPEGCRGEPLDSRADLWALGVLLFEALTGQRPFDGPNPAAIITAILNQPPADLRALRPEVPAALADLIGRLLLKDRAARLGSARLLGAAAEALLHGDLPELPAAPIAATMAGAAPVAAAVPAPAVIMPGASATVVDLVAQVVAAPTTPNNLPSLPTALIGRAREVGELRTLLRHPDTRLLTLSGPGGTGKTRLSLAVAAEVLDDYPDGVYFIDLSPITSAPLVATTIAQLLGLAEEAGTPLTVALKAYLHERRMLLVLDNFEQVLAAAPLLSELLTAAPRLVLLVTSRARLRLSHEHEYPVPPLGLPRVAATSPLTSGNATTGVQPAASGLLAFPAIELFVERAAAARPGFALSAENAAAVVAICARLDGLPLAIELAAARCNLLGPHELLAGLDNRLALLNRGARDRSERQRTLRGAIDWSYNLLTPDEQQLFAYLSVFAGGFSLAAAGVVLATGDPQQPAGPIDMAALDLLDTLLENSLIRSSDGALGTRRFSMLETIREYASAKLAESGAAPAIHARHAAYALALAEQAEPELTGAQQDVWLERLATEHDNLRAALTVGIRDQGSGGGGQGSGTRESYQIPDPRPLTPTLLPPHTALRLAAALWRFWYTRGYLAEGRGWLERALAASPDAPAVLRARALNGAGGIAWAQGDNAAARVHLEAALPLFRAAADQRGMARVLNVLGVVARNERAYPLAQCHYAESLALFKALGDRWGMATTLSNLGVVAQHQHDLAGAQGFYRQSLALRRALNDRRGIAVSLNNLGEVAHLLGDTAQARSCYLESLALCSELGDREGVVSSLEALAAVNAGYGEAIVAARLWGAAEAQREQIGAAMPPAERASHAAAVAAARAASNPQAFANAWAAGRCLAPEQAAAEAARHVGVGTASRRGVG